MEIPNHLHALCNRLINFAIQQLKKNGSFYPFAATMEMDGSIRPLILVGENEYPNPQELYKELDSVLRLHVAKGGVQAVAVAANVDVPKDLNPAYPDGIRITLETPEVSIWIYIPYRLNDSAEMKKFEDGAPIQVHHAKRSYF